MVDRQTGSGHFGSDPQESYSLFDDRMDMGWELAVTMPLVAAWEKSVAEYPNTKPGTDDDFKGYAGDAAQAKKEAGPAPA